MSRVSLASLAIATSQAATLTWTGAAGNLWSNAGNWQPAGVPASGDVLIFPAGAANPSNTNDLVGLAPESIRFTGDGYSLGGSGISLNNLGAVASSTNTVAMPLSVANGSVLNVWIDSDVPFGATIRLVGGLSGTGRISLGNLVLSIGGSPTFGGDINPHGCRFTGTAFNCPGRPSPLPGGAGVRLEGVAMPSAQIGGPHKSRLFGSGTVGPVDAVSLSPGSSTGSLGLDNGSGALVTGNLRIYRSDAVNASELWLDIQGSAPGIGYDQITVNGTVSITGARLNLRMAEEFVPTPGQVFTLIDNDGTDAVTGTFDGLTEGSTVSVNGVDMQVSYRGGDGNDVTLTVTRTSRNWTGAASAQWSNPGNWAGGVIPLPGDRIRFPAGAANLSNTNDLAGLAVHSIVFDGAGYRLGGNALSVTNAITAGAGIDANVIALPIDVQANAVTISPPGTAPLRLSGGLAGSGPIRVDGRQLAIAGAASYSGTITLACGAATNCGVLRLEDASMPLASVISSDPSNRQLSVWGSGTLGAVSGASLSPCPPAAAVCSSGDGTAMLSTGALSTGATLDIRIDGPGAGSGHDGIAVSGEVRVGDNVPGSTMLRLSKNPAFSPTHGQVFTIIGNDGTDLVSGRFNGNELEVPRTSLTHGTSILLGGSEFVLSYNGGDGNDVTLTALTAPRLWNISTRGQVLGGDNVLIAGFVIGGTTPKTVLVRAVGPSLTRYGVSGALANPLLQLFSGQTQIAANDNWMDSPNAAQIVASELAPLDALESAILVTLPPGLYTAIVSGMGGTTGIGLVEVFEAEQPHVPLLNIATRGHVGTDHNVMIAGFIIRGTTPQTVVVRARGPSLADHGVPNVLMNPVLELHSIATNDDWQSASNAATIQSSGFAPPDPRESAIYVTLNPGPYTAIVRGVGGTTGVGIVEVFAVP